MAILVIGSSHIDVLADFEVNDRHLVDKIGSLSVSVGGTGYNIAKNLVQHGYKVDFYTHLRESSVFANFVHRLIEQNGINTENIIFDKNVPESGFVAHRTGKRIVSAVSRCSIEEANLDYTKIRALIFKSNIVVLETNLSQDQLEAIIDICLALNKPVFISAVSEHKVSRLIALGKKYGNILPIKMISMNLAEAHSLFNKSLVRKPDRILPELVQNLVECKNVIVTRGDQGYIVRHNNQTYEHEAPHTPIKISETITGAGDALAASIVAMLFDKGDYSDGDVESYVNKFVSPVLNVREATQGAIGGELKNLTSEPPQSAYELKVEKKGFEFWQKFLSVVGSIFGIIASIWGAIWAIIKLFTPS